MPHIFFIGQALSAVSHQTKALQQCNATQRRSPVAGYQVHRKINFKKGSFCTASHLMSKNHCNYAMEYPKPTAN